MPDSKNLIFRLPLISICLHFPIPTGKMRLKNIFFSLHFHLISMIISIHSLTKLCRYIMKTNDLILNIIFFLIKGTKLGLFCFRSCEKAKVFDIWVSLHYNQQYNDLIIKQLILTEKQTFSMSTRTRKRDVSFSGMLNVCVHLFLILLFIFQHFSVYTFILPITKYESTKNVCIDGL